MFRIAGYNNLMDDLFRSEECTRTFSPRTDVAESSENYEFHVEVPGYEEDNLKVEVLKGVLNIKGSVKEKKEGKDDNDNKKYLRKEQYRKSFERRFMLPDNANKDEMSANLKNGILTITINKKEEEKALEVKIG